MQEPDIALPGFDQALYAAAWELEIPFTVAVPFVGQESKWPEIDQSHYRAMLEDAEEVVVISEGGYANCKFAKRDEWLVDHADLVLALLDDRPDKSGTRITVEYATSKDKAVENLWTRYEKWIRT